MTRESVLDILLSSGGAIVSGEALAREIGVSRMAISKAVSSLKEEGYPISVKERKGYTLSIFDLFRKEAVVHALKGVIKVYYYDSLKGSSNNEAKVIAVNHKEPFCVVVGSQEGGKGRLGRSFSSPEGGLYISIHLPSSMLSQGDLITRKSVQIKWVNDLYMGGRKFTGILTEGIVDLELGGLDGAVIGIGVNVNSLISDYPEDIRGIVTTLRKECGRTLDRLSLLKKIIVNVIEYQKKDYIDEYRRRCFILGRKITVNKFSTIREAYARDIDERARLVVEYDDGTTETLSSAEVTLHNS